MNRLALLVKPLWRDVLCLASLIVLIVSAAVFLILFLLAGMAFCFVAFFAVNVARLAAPRRDVEEERSIPYPSQPEGMVN